MTLLDHNEYEKALEPVKQVKINHLFARAVIEKHVEGPVYVDDINNPKTFYVVHPYGISLLFGETENEAFNQNLLEYILNIYKKRLKCEWLQAWPESWNKKLTALLGNKMVKSTDNVENPKVEENTRVNFKFNKEKYLHFKQKNLTQKFDIRRTDKEMYAQMDGTVIPKYFWRDADHFRDNGIGFSLIIADNAVSTAYSAFIFEYKLEIGIETKADFRAKGFAMYVCAALIDYCIKNDYEPIWSCKFENTASYLLAQKLGFEPTVYIPFYKINI
jgi:hypothetical protein